MTETEKKDKRKNDLHWRLMNWGAYVRAEKKDGPRSGPNAASWHDQVTGRVVEIDPQEPEYIDAEDAERTQAAMVRMMARDIESATFLIKKYRDGWHINVDAEVAEFRRKTQEKKDKLDHNVHVSRNKLWKYL